MIRAMILLTASVGWISGCQGASTDSPREIRWDAIVKDTTSTEPDREAVTAVWILRTRDCFDCPGIDRELRNLNRVAAERGLSLPLLVIHVGQESDRGIVERYLRSARISGEIVTIHPRDLRRGIPNVSPPDLLLVRGKRLFWSLASEAARVTSEEALVAAINQRAALGSVPPTADPDSILQIGQLIRVHRQADEVLGFVGKVAGCWAAFYLSPPSEEPSTFRPLEFERDQYHLVDASITLDTLYAAYRRGDLDPAHLIESHTWIPLSREFVAEVFTGCWP
jgi:hypothetical protein